MMCFFSVLDHNAELPDFKLTTAHCTAQVNCHAPMATFYLADLHAHRQSRSPHRRHSRGLALSSGALDDRGQSLFRGHSPLSGCIIGPGEVA